MSEEIKKTPEEILSEACNMIGKETAPVKAPYPVAHETIRRYCMMVEDENPLFLDPVYGKNTKYGKNLYPPFAAFGIMNHGSPKMIANIGGNESGGLLIIPPTPGRYFINMSQDYEWFKPVLEGDHLTSKIKLTNVYIKAIRIDPKAFWIENEMIVLNQNKETVCTIITTILSHRSPDEVALEDK